MRRERRAREWHVNDVVEALKELDPELEVRDDYIRYLEAGPRKPGAVLLAALCRIFDSEPTPLDEEETSAEDTRLVEVLERIADELAGLREDLRSARGA